MALAAVAPCQCFTPGGVQITSPGLISRFTPPSSCTHPVPDVTIRICPAGWVCQAERAPGSNVTRPPVEGILSFAPNSGSTITAPVKYSAAPLDDGRDPFGKISISCAEAGAAPRRAREIAIAIVDFISRSRYTV